MPDSVKDQCLKFVNTYSDVVIDFISHQITPEEVCQQIGLCVTKDALSNAEQFEMLSHVEEIEEGKVEP